KGLRLKKAGSPVHDVAGVFLTAREERGGGRLVQRTHIDLSSGGVFPEEAGLDVRRRFAEGRTTKPTGGSGIKDPVRVRHVILVICAVHVYRSHELLYIVDAGGAVRRRFCRGQRWKKQARENGNNTDDHQKLDEGKASAPLAKGMPQRNHKNTIMCF